MPPSVSARMLKLCDTMKARGGNLGMPHTQALGDGLFEVRAKAKEGIGRSLFCYMENRQIVILWGSQRKPIRCLSGFWI